MAAKREVVRGGVFPLGREPGGDIAAHTSAAERLALMWPLALEAWSLTGRPLPEYDRGAAPVRVVRRDVPIRPSLP